MIKNDIGINAGVIWHLLSDKGALSIRQIGELTGYKEVMIVLAIGWLARENKIRFYMENEHIHIELISYPSDIYY